MDDLKIISKRFKLNFNNDVALNEVEDIMGMIAYEIGHEDELQKDYTLNPGSINTSVSGDYLVITFMFVKKKTAGKILGWDTISFSS